MSRPVPVLGVPGDGEAPVAVATQPKGLPLWRRIDPSDVQDLTKTLVHLMTNVGFPWAILRQSNQRETFWTKDFKRSVFLSSTIFDDSRGIRKPKGVRGDRHPNRMVTKKPFEILSFLSEYINANFSDLYQSIALALISAMAQDSNAATISEATLKASYPAQQQELRQMLRHTFNLLTSMLDVFLFSVLQFSFIESPRSLSSGRRNEGFLRPWTKRRMKLHHFPTRAGSSVKRFRQLSYPLSARFRQSQVEPADAPLPAPATRKRMSSNRAWNPRKVAAQGYRYPPLVASIERILMSGLGVEVDGVWNGGLLLRLGIAQLLSGSPHYGLSAISQCLFIAENEGHTCQSRLLRSSQDGPSLNSSLSNLPSSMLFCEDLISDLDRSLAFPTLIKAKVLINQIRDFSGAARCCCEWLQKRETGMEVPTPDQPLFASRIDHLLGISYLGHSTKFLRNSEKRKTLTEAALNQFTTALRTDSQSWSLYYHQALCLAHLSRFSESAHACKESIKLFSGYPGTWYLLAASTAGDAGSPMADKTDRLMRAVDVLQLGLQHCRAHVVLLFGLLLAVMKLGPDYTLPRYFDFLAADAPPSSLSFVDQMLRCAEAQPFPAGREILQEGNADDRASERSAAALYDGLRLFDLLVHQILRLHYHPATTATTNEDPAGSATEAFPSVYPRMGSSVLVGLRAIDRATDSELKAALSFGEHDANGKEDGMGENADGDTAENQPAGDDLSNSFWLDELSLGGAIRAQLTPLAGYSDAQIHWQGLPVPSHYDIQYELNMECSSDAPQDTVAMTEIMFSQCERVPSCSVDRLSIHSVMLLMVDLLCDAGRLDLSQEVLHRTHRLMQITGQSEKITSSEWVNYQNSLLHLELCKIMKDFPASSFTKDTADRLTDLSGRLAGQNLLRPLCSRTLTLRGAVAIAMGDFATAMDFLRQSLLVNSGDTVALRLLVLAQSKFGLTAQMVQTANLVTELEDRSILLPFDWLPIEVL